MKTFEINRASLTDDNIPPVPEAIRQRVSVLNAENHKFYIWTIQLNSLDELLNLSLREDEYLVVTAGHIVNIIDGFINIMDVDL